MWVITRGYQFQNRKFPLPIRKKTLPAWTPSILRGNWPQITDIQSHPKGHMSLIRDSSRNSVHHNTFTFHHITSPVLTRHIIHPSIRPSIYAILPCACMHPLYPNVSMYIPMIIDIHISQNIRYLSKYPVISIYVYIYIYTCTYTHIYIYNYIQSKFEYLM